MKNNTWIAAMILLLAMSTMGIAACDNQGPAEEAGENIDDAADDTADAWDDTTDDMEDSYEDATEE
ncbi:MAG: hypothetical protein EA349_11270 [Halomonadaceae bacterium]|nr:MAG: hypothetical protein EA349_11270 [Halomonadaceae bacterium]